MSMVRLTGLQGMIDGISRERNLPKTAVEAALREALLKGYERYRRTQSLDGRNIFDETYFDNFEVELDTDEEGFRVLATKSIVEEVDSPDHEIALIDVQEVAAEAQLGDTVILDVTPDRDDFGRMAAIQTKQVLAQKLRDQQRKLIQEEFQELESTVLQGRILRFERQSVIVAVTSGYSQPEVEAELPKREQLPNDTYRANGPLKVYLKKVCEGSQRGPQLLVSRADAGLVVYLFANEVPEIEDDIVRIVAVAREANPPSRHVGPRTKIAVDTVERDVDPVGACIGARGSRIQVVVNELRGEKIDVIRWSPDPATYIANALSPARVVEVRLMNPEERQAHVLVGEDQLSLAIGKEGQNVRLAARLTGWKIDIRDVAKYDRDREDEDMSAYLADRAESLAQAAALAAEASEFEGDDIDDMNDDIDIDANANEVDQVDQESFADDYDHATAAADDETDTTDEAIAADEDDDEPPSAINEEDEADESPLAEPIEADSDLDQEED
ncbi:MAG: transcription termination factor NusA [Oscillatoriales cyanobacterium]|nr:MAG: transcription termination factor NusA [Oscillatoriales cyanobacterium]